MPVSSIDELFAEVYANPDDDQVRRVLSDALLAIGDPRGEFILFQLEPDKDFHRRAMRLIQAHGLTWLGPLRDSVIPLAYERGFIASVGLRRGAGPIDFDLPMWGTIHTIELDGLVKSDLAGFRVTPAMRSLKRLIGLAPRHRELLRARQPEAMARLRLDLEGHDEPSPGDSATEPYDPIAE